MKLYANILRLFLQVWLKLEKLWLLIKPKTTIIFWSNWKKSPKFLLQEAYFPVQMTILRKVNISTEFSSKFYNIIVYCFVWLLFVNLVKLILQFIISINYFPDGLSWLKPLLLCNCWGNSLGRRNYSQLCVEGQSDRHERYTFWNHNLS